MATGGEPSAASSSNFDDEIKKLMGKGKVHLVCSEFLDAVKCFEEATKKLDIKYGEASDQCGEAYFYYGKSLLEVARMEGGVLGNALQGAIETTSQENGTKDENNSGESCTDKTKENDKDNKENENKDIFVNDVVDESEKEKISSDVLDAMTVAESKNSLEKELSTAPNNEKSSNITTSDDLNKMKETSEGQDEKKSVKPSVDNQLGGDESKPDEHENNAKTEEKKEAEKKADKNVDDDKIESTETKEEQVKEPENKDDEGENDEGEDEGEGEDDAENIDGDENPEEEEPTYMELAWQMLEMARIVFSKRDSKEGKLLLAQCHLKLGEIQMEQEQFLSAVDDFLKCLDVQKELLSPDDRLIAETAYNIGLAFSFQSMHDKSKEYFTQALNTIGLRIKTLESGIKEAESKSKGKEIATDENPLVANTKELKELQELYPEVKLKVDDAEEMLKQPKNKSDVMGNGSSTTIGFGESSHCSKDQPATLIATKKPVAAKDISHLVHRNKRKPEEAEDSNAKKPRQDNEAEESKEKPTETANNNGQTAAMET